MGYFNTPASKRTYHSGAVTLKELWVRRLPLFKFWQIGRRVAALENSLLELTGKHDELHGKVETFERDTVTRAKGEIAKRLAMLHLEVEKQPAVVRLAMHALLQRVEKEIAGVL